MNGAIGFFAVIIVLIIILAILASCIKIVPQAQALVVERLEPIWEPGQSVFISRCRFLTVWPNV